MKRLVLFLLTVISFSFAVKAQEPPKPKVPFTSIFGNDTLPHFDLPTINVYPQKKFRSKSEEQQYWRLVMRVKKVLPYAKEAAILYEKYRQEVPPDARGKDRRAYVRKAEHELIEQYGPIFKKMSINDGKVLVKLIDRETHMISYDLIHELKGGVSAVLWQGVARIFGNNLKTQYDPMGEDRQIEQIIYFIEIGLI